MVSVMNKVADPDGAADLYPSRNAGKPSVIGRADPAVYTDPEDASPGPLTRRQLLDYENQGFLVLDAFFGPDDVRALQEELNRLWAGAADSGEETVIREPDSEVVRSIFAVHEGNAMFRQLARDRRLIALAEQLLGSRVYIHQSRVNYKSGFAGKEFYWHSDFETWHVEDGMPRMRAVSFSIALSQNTPANGPLMLIPGSHKHYVACPGETPEDHHKMSLRRQEYGVPDRASLAWLAEQGGGISVSTGAPGSLTLFECNTMHGSNSNISPNPRSNVFLVYNSVENALTAPFGGMKPRPGYIASRDFTALSPLNGP